MAASAAAWIRYPHNMHESTPISQALLVVGTPKKYHPAEHLTVISKTHGSIRNEDRKKKAGTQSRGTPTCTSIIKCLKSVKTRIGLFFTVEVLVGVV